MATTSKDLWGPAISIKGLTVLSSYGDGMYIGHNEEKQQVDCTQHRRPPSGFSVFVNTDQKHSIYDLMADCFYGSASALYFGDTTLKSCLKYLNTDNLLRCDTM
jgi:hypothetical protein